MVIIPCNFLWQFYFTISVLQLLRFIFYKYEKNLLNLSHLFSTFSFSFLFPKWGGIFHFRVTALRSCLYEKIHPTQVRRLTWVTSRLNGAFHFVKANRFYENGFISPSRDLTLTQVRLNLGGIIFLHVNSFCQAVPPRQDC